MKIADKAAARAMAKDAFINKGTSYNPFTMLNTDNAVLMDVAHKIGVELGSSFNDVVENLNLIKSLELSRKNLVVQSVKFNVDNSKAGILDSDMDNNSHNESVDNALSDLDDVMVLRKGHKMCHRKKTVRKKKRIVNLPIIGTFLLSGEVRRRGIPKIVQNDRFNLELSGSG